MGKLKQTIKLGIAYHHADLPEIVKKTIEEGYLEGCLQLLCCTSTLAVGVNLPARRVIFFNTKAMGNSGDLQGQQYKQMSGRAGRTGKGNTQGDSYLLLDENNYYSSSSGGSSDYQHQQQHIRNHAKNLMNSPCLKVKSCFLDEAHVLKFRIMLIEAIVQGVVSSEADLKNYVHCTLAAKQLQSLHHSPCARLTVEPILIEKLQSSLDWLQEKDFLKRRKKNHFSFWKGSRLAEATLASMLGLEDALEIYEYLETFRDKAFLASPLHLLCCIVPRRYYSTALKHLRKDVERYKDSWWYGDTLSIEDKKVALHLGITTNLLETGGKRNVKQLKRFDHAVKLREYLKVKIFICRNL